MEQAKPYIMYRKYSHGLQYARLVTSFKVLETLSKYHEYIDTTLGLQRGPLMWQKKKCLMQKYPDIQKVILHLCLMLMDVNRRCLKNTCDTCVSFVHAAGKTDRQIDSGYCTVTMYH